MANPYYPYKSEANMMRALAANHERLEEEARHKRNAGNAALKETQEVQNSLQRREEEVDAYLKEKNKEKIQTGGDGNCFFYAIQGYGDIKGIPELSISVLEMREAVAQTIEADIKKKRKDQLYATSFVSSSALQEHTAVIRQCKERGNSHNPYANEPDIIAFSDHFGVCIIVHDWNNTSLKKYHMNKYRYSVRTCGKKGNPVIDILRTNENHYSLLMPIDDREYNALKNLVESVSLPLDLNIVTAHHLQLREMAKQAEANLSLVRLNQPAASAASAAQAAASRSVLNNAPPYNLSFTPEQLAQQLAIQANLNRRTAKAASKPMSGNSAASPIVLNGLNMPWECSVCTFENQPNASNCTMCGAPKPASSSSSKPPASPIVLNGINQGKSENLSSHANNATHDLSRVRLNSASNDTPYYNRLVKLREQYNSIKDTKDIDEILNAILSIERSKRINETSTRYIDIDRLFQALLNAYKYRPEMMDDIKRRIYQRLLKEMGGGGTRKHKKLRRTQKRRTRPNKNKSRRRL